MGRRLSFLAILAICVTETFSIPQEADPIPIDPEYPEEPLDCEWGVWGPCGATCGIGRQAIQSKKDKSIAMYVYFIHLT